MSDTKIEWATKVWNPVTGCSPVSEGCKNCYAKKMAVRLTGRFGYPAVNPFLPGVYHPDKLLEPFKWKKPQRVFICSMSDLFHEDIPILGEREILNPLYKSIFGVIAKNQQHQFLMLTKRPERMKTVIEKFMLLHAVYLQFSDTDERHLGEINFEYGEKFPRMPLPNLWLGVSAENQETLNRRVPVLLDTPAAGRFVSVEPMLGKIDLNERELICEAWNKKRATIGTYLDWVICGGETGSNYRPIETDWVRELQEQCASTSTAFFFKQRNQSGDDLLDGKKYKEFPKMMKGENECQRFGDYRSGDILIKECC
ncbi:hypothetical protein FACS1894189_3670 [Planctomycetales bacterium]|nr:hypothetical protein FACS1894189_3670 [Planctomycetales bacterium]